MTFHSEPSGLRYLSLPQLRRLSTTTSGRLRSLQARLLERGLGTRIRLTKVWPPSALWDWNSPRWRSRKTAIATKGHSGGWWGGKVEITPQGCLVRWGLADQDGKNSPRPPASAGRIRA